jgi:uncharacterized protein (DUF58 family)
VSAARRRVFPLVPRRRFAGVPFGDRRSPRRGSGDEIAGSRPYHPGDHISAIDWKASARLSAARGMDEFLVREFFAEESVRVALVCDRRPTLELYGAPFPWLDKARAALAAAELIAASAAAARAELAYLDLAGGRPHWLPPTRGRLSDVGRRLREATFDAPADGLERALRLLTSRASELALGTFVFVVSDFLPPVSPSLWRRVRQLEWDVIAVVIQDPVWEQSFPDVGGVVVPFADPVTGRVAPTRLSGRRTRAQRQQNEARLRTLQARFRLLHFDQVLLSSAEPEAVAERFDAWARRRRLLLRSSA